MTEPVPLIRMPMAEEPRVSLLIPTTSQAGKLEACLRSLAAHLPAAVPCEVIVVLNAPTAAVRRLVRENCHGLKITESAANLGVAGGYNRARSLAGGEFLVLLHDDVEIGPGWLEPLLATAAAHPEAGAIGCRVLNPDGTPQHAGSILWRNGLTSPVPVPDELPDQPWPVDYTGTCCILVRTALWDAIGGLDEGIYPAYYVDVSLAMRLRRLGATVLCAPAATLRHHAKSSSTKPFREFLCLRNRARFLTQWADAMLEFEPWAPDSPDAIPNALRGTRLTAQRLAASWQPIAPGPLPPHDPVCQEIRHFQLAAEVANAWAEHLIQQLTAENTAALASAERQLARLREKLAARDQKIKTLQARSDRLAAKLRQPHPSTPWQRLRRWLIRRFARPGGGDP
jgi:GT2 family glycosyltransferase